MPLLRSVNRVSERVDRAAKGQPTVAPDDLAGDPSHLVHGENGFGDVVGRAEPPERGPAGDSGQPVSRGARPSIGVSVTPGATPFTRSVGAHSAAATLITMSSAAFDAQYTPIERSTRWALTLLMATMDPPPAASIGRASERSREPDALGVDAHDAVPLVDGDVEEHPAVSDPALTVTTVGTPSGSTVCSAAAVDLVGNRDVAHDVGGVRRCPTPRPRPPRRAASPTTAAPMPDPPPTTTARVARRSGSRHATTP